MYLCLCMLIRQEHTFAALNWRVRHKIELDRMQFSKQLLLFEAFCILAFGNLCHMCYIASIHWWHLRFTCETYYTRKILRASKLMHQCRFGVFLGGGDLRWAVFGSPFDSKSFLYVSIRIAPLRQSWLWCKQSKCCQNLILNIGIYQSVRSQ